MTRGGALAGARRVAVSACGSSAARRSHSFLVLKRIDLSAYDSLDDASSPWSSTSSATCASRGQTGSAGVASRPLYSPPVHLVCRASSSPTTVPASAIPPARGSPSF
ncbi:hypothetical protein BDA96_05G095100 [Sorghum bicolor]|uniref:Uncharacterized protein n=2 Tax=Sorghum bicolor TaxID=4558 RepID=A0A1Z5RHH2_SORBI|nr:hypothetical protein BDA96_05G095100 [Sorghum bicolor]OQU83210.1 hypothetical protein SORBI_3005G092301 [Sorghum bicolor]OQU83211.1 hypothetical protein SORBI_3005G092301 [Sorghum bicolor]